MLGDAKGWESMDPMPGCQALGDAAMGRTRPSPCPRGAHAPAVAKGGVSPQQSCRLSLYRVPRTCLFLPPPQAPRGPVPPLLLLNCRTLLLPGVPAPTLPPHAATGSRCTPASGHIPPLLRTFLLLRLTQVKAGVLGTSMVIQWLRLRLPMQRVQVCSLVDPWSGS